MYTYGINNFQYIPVIDHRTHTSKLRMTRIDPPFTTHFAINISTASSEKFMLFSNLGDVI